MAEKTMTVNQLYDYITSQITPEAALKKLLSSSLLTYEHLKFEEGEEVHPIIIIANAAMDMGWNMAVEKEYEDMRGISVGTPEYMKDLFPKKGR